MRKGLLSFVVLASLGFTAWLASAQQVRGPVVTTNTLINAAGNGAEWLSYGHDFGEV